jgi:predicted nuclease of predicted toxin-antitoxin system
MPWNELEIGDYESKSFHSSFQKKARFLIDENMGIEAARIIKELGWNAVYVSDVGLLGHPDENVFAYSYRENRVLLTHDDDFLDDAKFPQYRNPGVVILPGANGDSKVLEREIARILITIGKYREVYRGYKIRIREDGTWEIRSIADGRNNVRFLKFEKGKIFEMGK